MQTWKTCPNFSLFFVIYREMKSTVELIQERLKRKGIDPHVNQYCSSPDDTEITKEEGLLLKVSLKVVAWLHFS